MSQQQRSQNFAFKEPKQRNKANDKSARPPKSATSQQSHDVNSPTSAAGKQPTAADKQPTAADKQPTAADKQPTTASQQLPDFDAEFHVDIDEQRANTILSNMKKMLRDRNEKLLKKSVRSQLQVIESQIKEGEAQNKDSPDVNNFAEYLLKCVDDALKMVEELELKVKAKFAAEKQMKSDMAIVEELKEKIKEEIENDIKRENLFLKERDEFETQLEKINAEIDFFTNKRDDLCSQIAELNNTEATIVPTIENFRQSNEQLQQQIRLLEAKSKDDNDMASNVTGSALHWIDDKKQAISTFDSLKSKLKKEKKKVNASLKAEKKVSTGIRAEMESLNQECSHLESQTAAMESETELRIKEAEKKFEQKKSKLASALENITNEMKLLKFETDQKKLQVDNLQQMNEGISTLQKDIKASKEKIKSLRAKKWKMEHRIKVLEDYARVHDRSLTKRAPDNISNVSASKRPRLPSTNPNENNSGQTSRTSGSSSFDMKDLVSETGSRKSGR